jgi:hypothetical protein
VSLLPNSYQQDKQFAMDVHLDSRQIEDPELSLEEGLAKFEALAAAVEKLAEQYFPGQKVVRVERWYVWKCAGCGREWRSNYQPLRVYCCEREKASHSEVAAREYQRKARHINQGTL